MKSLLDLVLGPGRGRAYSGSNRRQSIRYRADAPVLLGWWQDDLFRQVECLLLDISQGGASVLVSLRGLDPKALPRAEAFLRLSDDEGTDWTSASVLATRKVRRKVVRLHLQFPGGCSYSCFRAALPGTTLDGEGACYESAEFDTRYWR